MQNIQLENLACELQQDLKFLWNMTNKIFYLSPQTQEMIDVREEFFRIDNMLSILRRINFKP